jgi:hypothetical protein
MKAEYNYEFWKQKAEYNYEFWKQKAEIVFINLLS